MMCIHILASFAGHKVKNSMETYSSASPEAQIKQYAQYGTRNLGNDSVYLFVEKKKYEFWLVIKFLLFLLGCVTNFAVLILGFWHWDMLGPAIHQSHLKTVWSWRAVQADRDTQKVEAWRTGFWKKDFKKANLCNFTAQRSTQTSKLNPRILFSLSLSQYCLCMPVQLMLQSWLFFQRIPCGVHCSYMKKIYIYI